MPSTVHHRLRLRADELQVGDVYIERATRLHRGWEAPITSISQTSYTTPNGAVVPRVVIATANLNGAFTCAPHSRHDVRRPS